MRGTTRTPSRAAEIQAAGAEAHVGDPDRIATLTAALDGATILCWLLGSAAGPADALRALHTTRLAALLSHLIDTTVRGVVYEAAGSIDPALLRGGAQSVKRVCGYSQIPFRILDADPADHGAWLARARANVNELLGIEVQLEVRRE